MTIMTNFNRSAVSQVREHYDTITDEVVAPSNLSFAWGNVFEIARTNAWIAVVAILLVTGITTSTGVANASSQDENTITTYQEGETIYGFGSATIGGGN